MDKKLSRWVLGYFIAYLLLLYFVPVTVGALTIALLFVLIIENLSLFFNKKLKIPRSISVIISSILFYGILVYAIYSIVPIMINEAKGVMGFVEQIIKKPASDIFPKVKSETFLNIIDSMMKWTGNILTDFAGKVGTYIISKIPSFLTSVTLLIIASSYISVVLPSLKKHVTYLFPNCDEERTKNFLKELYGDLRKFVGGQMINALIVGLIVWMGMSLFGIKYAGFLGLLSGITDFIPFLGVIITALPSIFIGIAQKGIWGVVSVIVVLTIANQIEGWILAPKVLGDRVKLNWFIVLITMLGLSEIYGFIGVLLSVPVLIFIRLYWKKFVVKSAIIKG